MQTTASKINTLTGLNATNISSEILNSNRPIILKGFCKDWPIVKEAEKSLDDAGDYLLKHYNGRPVKTSFLEANQKGRVYYNPDMNGFNFVNKDIDFNEVIKEISAQNQAEHPRGVYMPSSGLDLFFPSLLNDLPEINELAASMVHIWLGNQTRVAAHFDFAQNLACCVIGRRTFTLFPPEQLENLYVGPLNKAPGGREISAVDLDNPDFQKFPKFRTALEHAQTAELETGDALVLPSMWWHHVAGLDPFNGLITYWWRNSPAYLGAPNNALWLSILSLRDLPKPQREAWKNIFDHYVFEHEVKNFQHIPESALSFLASPLDEQEARKLRAELQNKMRR